MNENPFLKAKILPKKISEQIKVISKKSDEVKDQENYVYIGRGSILGNPYTHQKLIDTKALYEVCSRKVAIAKYQEYFLEQWQKNNEFRNEVLSLTNLAIKHQELYLVCYCSPLACHGDILKKHIEHLIKIIKT